MSDWFKNNFFCGHYVMPLNLEIIQYYKWALLPLRVPITHARIEPMMYCMPQ